ncbi:hypothetical protein WMO40_22375 [Bacillaceae bacterium CLA-AA-H227]|uniref:Uncharacterized protein n=1 Tax=Robertmurraya yapensis (ex Hitch et al 2024) TaxID=3133160 RepID=A0ACC6SHA0_9BACI
MSELDQNKSDIKNTLIKKLDDLFELGFEAGVDFKNKIDFSTIPNGVKYSDVEKYLKQFDPDITRRKFTSYIEQGLLPEGVKKNEKLTLYLKEHILRYMFIVKYKNYLPLNRIKKYLETTQPAFLIMRWNSIFNPLEELDFKEAIKPIIDIFIDPIQELIDDELEGEFEEYSDEEVNIMKSYLSSFIVTNILLQYGKAYLDMFDEIMNSFATENNNVFGVLLEMADKYGIKYEQEKKEEILKLEQQKEKVQESIEQITINLNATNDLSLKKKLQQLLAHNENLLASIEILKRSWD